ncbi:unnamed protein product [Protopolystoma xenopodis]|uniref:Uncharacterized protein n=1 Tax=Protopolystoma xenopodis TaxID=117903 RepID=A0A3S5AKX8_9PLAT|nr:unnamed protein product [Protopolystoma xenopodis]
MHTRTRSVIQSYSCNDHIYFHTHSLTQTPVVTNANSLLHESLLPGGPAPSMPELTSTGSSRRGFACSPEHRTPSLLTRPGSGDNVEGSGSCAGLGESMGGARGTGSGLGIGTGTGGGPIHATAGSKLR